MKEALITDNQVSIPSPPAVSARLTSLDIFRGITIAAMILVNDPGSWDHIYSPLEHAAWDGWTHTDLVFPFFLFIVGVSLALSFARRIGSGGSRSDLLKHTLKRAAIIFAIGFFLAMFPNFNLEKLGRVRIMGVLQRIALCYAISGVISLYFSKRFRIGAILAALIGYWVLMKFVPVPGYGASNLSPEGNLAAVIDRALMYGHLWRPMWDPEGLLSSIPAVATVLIGTFVGDFLRSQSTSRYKVSTLFAAGIIGLALGKALHPFFPINKNLWTSTFVIFTAGYAMIALALCHWVLDVKRWRPAQILSKPFLVFGMNSLLAFVLSTFVAKIIYVIYKVRSPDGELVSAQAWIYTHWFEPLASDPRNSSLLFALTYVAIWLAVMWWLYAKKIFVKI